MPEADDKRLKIKYLHKRIRENDLTALGELLDLKSRDIQVIAYNIINDFALAEDIVNEVMVAFIENIHRFDNDSNLNGWLNTVAINKSIDYKRKHKKEIFSEFAASQSSGMSEEQLVNKLDILQVFEKLDDLEREVLVEKTINKANYEDISQKYNITHKQARRIYKSAKQNFMKLYNGK